jgi:pilus assembly protein Flp/PilA
MDELGEGFFARWIHRQGNSGNGFRPIIGRATGEDRNMLQMIIARLRKLAKNEEGVTAMEYGLIAAATVVAIATLMPGIGTVLSSIFSTISVAL